MQYASIIGTGSYVPEMVVTNHKLEEIVDTTDEWIQSRTGIKERRISTNESTAEMGYKAAEQALKMAEVKPEEIDLIICATITPDSFMPSTACLIQDKLKAINATAFDLAAACTGLVFAIITASQYIQCGTFRTVLVVGAETLSKVLDWKDRSTCVLFGDGASAVLLGRSDRSGIKSFSMKSDGSKADVLTLPALPHINHWTTNLGLSSHIAMDGQEVFKFAVRSVKEHILTLLEKEELTLDEIRYIIPHQANLRIIEHTAKLCMTSIDKFYMNLERFGNTSAASIGIALDEVVRSGNISDGDKLILVGFGGGLTSGSLLLEWVSHK